MKLKEAEQQVQRAHKENDALTQKTQKLQQDLEEQISTNTQLLAENAQRQVTACVCEHVCTWPWPHACCVFCTLMAVFFAPGSASALSCMRGAACLTHTWLPQVELKLKEDEINQVRSLATKEARMKEQMMKKVKDVEQKRIEVEGQRDILRAEISKLEREIETQRRQIDLDKKNIEDMAREKDLLQNNLRKTQTATQKQADLVKVQVTPLPTPRHAFMTHILPEYFWPKLPQSVRRCLDKLPCACASKGPAMCTNIHALHTNLHAMGTRSIRHAKHSTREASALFCD